MSASLATGSSSPHLAGSATTPASSTPTSPRPVTPSLLASSSSILPPSSKFIDRIQAKIQAKQPFFSFEYFPPKTADGLTNLYMRFDRMGSLGPVRLPFLPFFLLPFCSMHWNLVCGSVLSIVPPNSTLPNHYEFRSRDFSESRTRLPNMIIPAIHPQISRKLRCCEYISCH